MEKKLWWFSKKNEPAADYDEINNDYYGTGMSVGNGDESDSYDPYSGDDNGDVSVVLTGDPTKKEPLKKKTFTPLTCNDSADIVDAFKDGRVIVICIEELDKPNFLRLFDYLMGAVQALDGDLKRIDRDTVVLLPYGADEDISIDDLEEDFATDGEENEYDDEDDYDEEDDGEDID